jgi:O-antigen/teichoic acid export membrane protein
MPTPEPPLGATPLAAPSKQAADTPAGPERHSVARNAAALGIAQVATLALSLVSTFVGPRFLGPAAIGQYRLAISIWAMAAVLIAFGLNTVVTLDVARDRSAANVVGRAIACQLVAWVVAFVLIMGVAIVAYERTLVIVLACVGLSTLMGSIVGALRGGIHGLERMDRPAVIEVTSKVIATSSLVTVLVLGGGVTLVAATGLVAGLFTVVTLARAARGLLGPEAIRPRLQGSAALWRAGWPFLVNEAVLVVYFQVDTIVIAAMASRTELGWYSSADGVSAALQFAPTLLLASLFPVLARVGHTDQGELQRLVRRCFGFLMLLAAPIAIGTFTIATPACVLIFGDDFRESGPVLALFGLMVLLTYPATLLGRVALATGRQMLWVQLMIGATLVSIPLDLVLVPWTRDRFDNAAIGGVLAYLITESAVLVAALLWVSPGMLDRQLAGRSAKAIGAGVAMGLVVWPLRNTFILVPVLTGALVYGVAVIVLRAVSSEDREMLSSVLTRLSGRRRPRPG